MFVLKFYFATIYFSPLNTFLRKGKAGRLKNMRSYGSGTLGDIVLVPVVLDEDKVPYLDISGQTLIHTSCSLAAAVVMDLN
jgi:hypothetical protein